MYCMIDKLLITYKINEDDLDPGAQKRQLITGRLYDKYSLL